MNCKTLHWTTHSLQRMFKRAGSREEILATINHGDVVEDYPDDLPLPGRLLLHWHAGRPLHVVVASDNEGHCVVVTVYEPDNLRWLEDFRHRRRP